MARKRKRASGDDPPWWEIIRLKSTPAAHVGRVQAADAASAIKVAIEQYQITDPIQQRRLAAVPIVEGQ